MLGSKTLLEVENSYAPFLTADLNFFINQNDKQYEIESKINIQKIWFKGHMNLLEK